jgi:hypothetical protein
MAVAYESPPLKSNCPTNFASSWSFSYTNNGNAIALVAWAIENNTYDPPHMTATYNGSSFTQDFFISDLTYNAVGWTGLHLLNAASGSNTLVISVNTGTGAGVADYIGAYVVSVSGASTTASVLSNASAYYYSGAANATVVAPAVAVPSRVNDLVIGFADLNSGSSYITALTGTNITPTGTPAGFWASYTAGASPSVNVQQTFDYNAGDAAVGAATMGFSFSPSGAGPTNVSGVTIVSGISDPGDVTTISGVSIKHTGITLVDFT